MTIQTDHPCQHQASNAAELHHLANPRCGTYTAFPCNCVPPCDPGTWHTAHTSTIDAEHCQNRTRNAHSDPDTPPPGGHCRKTRRRTLTNSTPDATR